MPTRADRRARSLRIATRRRAIHLKQVHANDRGAVDCVCELAPFYFEKRSLGCDCRKRKKGQPRLPVGFGCANHIRPRIYKGRQLAREYGKGMVSGRLSMWEEWPRVAPNYC